MFDEENDGEKETSRQRRIRDRARMIAKAKRHASLLWTKPDPVAGWKATFAARDDYAKRNHDNRKPCSCEMCRNPRRSSWASAKDRLSIQERRKNERPSETSSDESADE
jgi:hypothetical protein